MSSSKLRPDAAVVADRTARRLRLAVLVLAALPVLALCLLELLGARGDVAFLSGTLPARGDLELASGLAYALSWFTATIVSPILLLGVAFEAALQRLLHHVALIARRRASRAA